MEIISHDQDRIKERIEDNRESSITTDSDRGSPENNAALIVMLKEVMREQLKPLEKDIKELKPLNDRMTAMENSISTIRNSQSGLEDQITNIKSRLNQTPGLAVGRKPSIFDYPVSRRNSISNPDIDLYPIDAYRKK